ncbi:hypothetical protein [Acidovorax sp. 69]|nr:hypothetical protein [Acidovorax sp. 69]
MPPLSRCTPNPSRGPTQPLRGGPGSASRAWAAPVLQATGARGASDH